MDFEKYVKFANEHPLCSVATVDGDQPQVRMFGMWFADKNGFYFSTGKIKDVYRQLSVNPRVGLLFYVPPETPAGPGSEDVGTMMRVTGTARFVDDPALRERLFTERPFLRPLAENVVIVGVENGEAWFWTWKDNARESAIEPVRF